MKTLILISFFFLLITQICFAQWFWQNPLPTGNNYYSTYFKSEDTGWVVGEAGTILKTIDGGNSWILQNVNPDVIGEYIQFVSEDIGWIAGGCALLKTIDGGNNWFIQDSSQLFRKGYFIDSLTGWITGGYYDILNTTDGGNTWINQYSYPGEFNSIIFFDEYIGYVVGYDWNTNQGIFLKTIDGGINWQNYLIGPSKYLQSVCFIDTNLGWIAGYDLITYKGIILKTTDGGINWNEQMNIQDIFFSSIKFINSTTGWAFGSSGTVLKTTNGGASWNIQTTNNFITSFLFPSIVNQNEIYAVGDYATILKTIDGGENWSNITNGIIEGFWDLYVFNDQLAWIASSSANGNIIRTINGGDDWEVIATGIQIEFYSIDFVTADIGWACGMNGIIIKSTDGGLSWFIQNSGVVTGLQKLYFFDTQTGLAIGDNGIILRTTNSGNSWQVKLSGTNEYLMSIYFIDQLAGWIGGTNGALLKTTDGGNSWAPLNINSQFHCYSIFFADYFIGWCVGMDATTQGLIYKTTDGGNSWTLTNSGIGFRKAIKFIDELNGLTVGLGNILYTTDGGNNWFEKSNITSNQLNDVDFVNNSLTGWIVGLNGTILKTINGGGILPVELISFYSSIAEGGVMLNWSTSSEINNFGYEVQRGLDDKHFYTIGFANGYGTTSEQHNYTFLDKNLQNGKYYYRLKQVDFDGSYEYSDVVEVEFRTLSSYLLEQCYPNPFNPTTTIGFGLQNKSNVKITILNAIGEEVAVVLNEEKDSGYYTVEFNAANLPSGVYFYRLQAGDFVQTKKMILMK